MDVLSHGIEIVISSGLIIWLLRYLFNDFIQNIKEMPEKIAEKMELKMDLKLAPINTKLEDLGKMKEVVLEHDRQLILLRAESRELQKRKRNPSHLRDPS